jgi:hypothetical protein
MQSCHRHRGIRRRGFDRAGARRARSRGLSLRLLLASFVGGSLLLLVISPASGTDSYLNDDVAVRNTAASEIRPVASGPYLAWSQNSAARPEHFDLFVQKNTQPVFKVNAPGTRAYPGGISGPLLVFGEQRGGRSNIGFFDLRARKRLRTPAGVNTRQPELNPTITGRWLLFNRIDRSRHRERLLVYNLKTKKHFSLYSVRDPLTISASQISWPYAVAVRCQSGGECVIYGFDMRSRRLVFSTSHPFLEGYDDSASVTSSGVVYYASVGSMRPCSSFQTRLLRASLHRHDTQVLRTLEPGQGIGGSYVVTEGSSVTVFYSRDACGRNPDIYKFTDSLEPAR